MRTRSANDWRDFWAERGERELRELMGDLGEHTTRVATLLGSRAPRSALAAELGRIRDAEPDDELAARIHDWFEHA